MNEQEALSRMIAPGTRRKGKFREGVIQIHLTRACNLSCYNCTQGSNLRGPYTYISLDNFRKACESLRGYFGVVGVFGGNPAMHPQFAEICQILREIIPREHRGIWCNDPITLDNAKVMRETFDPRISNLNVHLSNKAYNLFKIGWPESMPFGMNEDSRHSPVHLSMRDVLYRRCNDCVMGWEPGTEDAYGRELPATKCTTCDGTGKIYDEEKGWDLISNCPINRHWSAMMCEFRGELRAFFCEIAGAQAMLMQYNPEYPDTGLDPTKLYFLDSELGLVQTDTNRGFQWWQLPMNAFANQVRQHCHNCAVPLNGYGELAQRDDNSKEQTSEYYRDVYRPKRKNRNVEVVTDLVQLGLGKVHNLTRYIQNAKV